MQPKAEPFVSDDGRFFVVQIYNVQAMQTPIKRESTLGHHHVISHVYTLYHRCNVGKIMKGKSKMHKCLNIVQTNSLTRTSEDR